MKKPMFYVDFNEMPEPDLVLLSQFDTKVDSNGHEVILKEGMLISVFMNDVDQFGRVDNLLGAGAVVLNHRDDWSRHVKWCCRLDESGIQHESTRKNL